MKEFGPYFMIVMTTAGLLVCSAVAALLWAIKSGQFRELEGKSKSIFDTEEPERKITDKFPGKTKNQPEQNFTQ